MKNISSFCGRRDQAFTRRDFLQRAGAGFGALALLDLLKNSALAAPQSINPLAPKKPHHAPKAKRIPASAISSTAVSTATYP